ncbi:MAG: cheW40H-5 [Rhodocyclales bacterium]|nr:cheW40H-5 [Rhodocyclales bacterium]
MKARKPQHAIDWDKLHRQMAQANEALQRQFEPPPEVRDAILQQRALLLARAPVAVAAPGELLEVVEFMLAHERYALETLHVREVCQLQELLTLPGVPHFVLGVVNLRGHIISVIDLKRFFGLPEKGLTDLNKVIVLHDKEMVFGVLADQIIGVRTLPASEMQASLPTLTGIRAEYLRGVAPGRLVVLEAQKLIHDPALIVNDEVLQ